MLFTVHSSVRTTISHVHVPRHRAPASASRYRRNRHDARTPEARSGRRGRLHRRCGGMVQLDGHSGPGLLWAYASILAEAGGGLLTVLGLGGPIGPGLLAGDLVVVTIVAHLPQGLLGGRRQGRVGVPRSTRGRRARDRTHGQRRVVARSAARTGLPGLALACLAGAHGRGRGPGTWRALDASAEGGTVLARLNEIPSVDSAVS